MPELREVLEGDDDENKDLLSGMRPCSEYYGSSKWA